MFDLSLHVEAQSRAVNQTEIFKTHDKVTQRNLVNSDVASQQKKAESLHVSCSFSGSQNILL